MAAGWLLTLLALCGVWAGVFIGRTGESLSEHLAAAGGGLLFGVSLFWLIPEIGEGLGGRAVAILIVAVIAACLALIDAALTHTGHSARHGVVWPLLLATAIHSLLDGWSVRVLSVQPFTNVAATIGLALHKVPEGAAVGWIARRSIGSPRHAFLAGASAELLTVAGAFAAPAVNSFGAARFGVYGEAVALCVIAGGFLFLGVHAILPAWKRFDVIAVFLATLLLMAALTLRTV